MRTIDKFVSVIIPNYNHSKYLDQRIHSVLNQTYQYFEVIILDDCSTDNSREVIEKYRSNPHVSHIVYNEQNSGSTFKQWHKGFELAKGELIWIAESDDYCDSDLLESLVNSFVQYDDVCVAYAMSQFVDSTGALLPPLLDKNADVTFYQGKSFIKKEMLFGNAIYNASSAVFRKRDALSVDKQYMDYVAAGDRLFWIEMAECGNVVKVSDPKNYFRQHLNKVSPWKKRNGTTDKEDYKILRYLEKKGFLTLLSRLTYRDSKINEIKKDTFDNEMIREELIRLWSYNGYLSQKRIQQIMNIYHKLFGRQPYYIPQNDDR